MIRMMRFGRDPDGKAPLLCIAKHFGDQYIKR